MPAKIKLRPSKTCIDIFSSKKMYPNIIDMTKDRGIIIETDTPRGYLCKIIKEIKNAII